METIFSSETSVDIQRTTRRYIPEDSPLHNHRCENFKSCISIFLLPHLKLMDLVLWPVAVWMFWTLIGLLGRGFGQSHGLYLHRTTKTQERREHPRPERDSSPRSLCSRGRRPRSRCDRLWRLQNQYRTQRNNSWTLIDSIISGTDDSTLRYKCYKNVLIYCRSTIIGTNGQLTGT
jgi:hypothetical protein